MRTFPAAGVASASRAIAASSSTARRARARVPRASTPSAASRVIGRRRQGRQEAPGRLAFDRRWPPDPCTTPSGPILSSLSTAISASPCFASGTPAVSSSAVEHATVIQLDNEVAEAERRQHLADRAEDVGFDHGRRRADGVDVALVELAKPAARRTIRAPHRLNLIALEELRQLVLILRDDARQRHGQIVPKREIGLAARLVLAAFQNLEDELVALLAVLANQRLDVLEGRRLQRLEPVAFVDIADDSDHVLPASNVAGKEIARTARRFCGHQIM